MMLTSMFRRIGFVILVTALSATTWSTCQAVGSFQTKPAFPSDTAAGDSPVLPTVTWPKISAGDLVGGCGKGRVSDAQTHVCHGSADIR
jgi:hypothetical protein